ncbi:MAG: glycosyltransferase family 4 protein [Acidimicrobiales bacterium]
MPRVAFVSFRLGLDDGVSIVADAWADAFVRLGFETTTVAADGPVDAVVPGLGLGARLGDATTPPPTPDATDRALLAEAVADVDLVVVENLLSIPLNLPASALVADVLAGRPTIVHHHDPPWQRERFAHVTELPVDDPAWRHVTINQLTADEFAERGIDATCIYNGFDLPTRVGDRAGLRAELDVADDERLVVHPARAIARKNIGAALDLCADLGATYWLTGRAEEGYDDELARLLGEARCRVIRRPVPDRVDLYAAADLVAFPSTWEGFGNPPVEAALHRRPVAVGDYPVAAELRSLGFDWPFPDECELLAAELEAPDRGRLDRNFDVAERHLSAAAMTEGLQRLLERAGWWP